MRSSRGSATGSFAAWTRPRRRRVRPRDEGPQRLQVPPIPGIGPGELEAAREFPETLLVHEETERLLPELPLPDIRVTVEFRSEVAHRIVQVERADPTESDALVDRPEERLVAVPRPEVVARGERVTCVDTDPEAVRMGRAFHHFGELLEPIPDDRPRARRILQDRLRLLRRNRFGVSEHPRTAGENLDRVGPDRLAALRGERDALRDRDVGTEVHRSPDAGIASTRMSLPMSASAATSTTNGAGPPRLFRPVLARELSRLHDQIGKRQVVLALRKRIREFLPPAVLDPFPHDRIAEEQLDLTQLVKERDGRVDAHEGDFEAVVLEQVRHRVFVEGPLGTPSGLLPVVPVLAAEDKRPPRTRA